MSFEWIAYFSILRRIHLNNDEYSRIEFFNVAAAISCRATLIDNNNLSFIRSEFLRFDFVGHHVREFVSNGIASHTGNKLRIQCLHILPDGTLICALNRNWKGINGNNYANAELPFSIPLFVSAHRIRICSRMAKWVRARLYSHAHIPHALATVQKADATTFIHNHFNETQIKFECYYFVQF